MRKHSLFNVKNVKRARFNALGAQNNLMTIEPARRGETTSTPSQLIRFKMQVAFACA